MASTSLQQIVQAGKSLTLAKAQLVISIKVTYFLERNLKSNNQLSMN